MADKILDLIKEQNDDGEIAVSGAINEVVLNFQYTNKARDNVEENEWSTNDFHDEYAIEVKARDDEFDSNQEVVLDLPTEIINEPDKANVKERIEQIVEDIVDSGKQIKLYLQSRSKRFVLGSRDDCMLLIAVNRTGNSSRLFGFKKRIRFQNTSWNSSSDVHEFLKSVAKEYLEWKYDNGRAKLEQYPDFLEMKFKPFEKYLDAEMESLKDPKFKPKADYIDKIMKNVSTDDASVKGKEKESESRQIKNAKDDDADQGQIILEFEQPVPRQLQEPGNKISVEWEESAPGKKEKQGKKVQVTIENWDDERLSLIFNDGKNIKLLKNAGKTGTVFLQENLTNVFRKKDAVYRLKNPFLTPLQNLVDMMLRPEVFSSMEEQEVLPFNKNIKRDDDETVMQYQALQKIVSTNDLVLVQGPPGSGKTTLIVELVKQCITNGMRVLMSAPTHVAVDNIIERLDKERSVGMQIVRIGQPSKSSPEVQKYFLKNLRKDWRQFLIDATESTQKDNLSSELLKIKQYFQQSENEQHRFLDDMIINASNLVCGTSTGVVSIYGRNTMIDDFDVMIIDESSKATILEFLIPATRAKKWVIIGDQNQLPPYIDDREIRIFFHSFFEKRFNYDKDIDEDAKDKMNKIAREILSTRKGNDKLETTEDWAACTDFRVQPFILCLMNSFKTIYEGEHFLSGKSYIEPEWRQVRRLFSNDRHLIKIFKGLIEILGSCYHYFFKRIESSRKIALEYQYRMPEIIGKFISNTFYEGKLKNVEETRTHGLNIKMDLLFPGQDSSYPIFSFLSTSRYDKVVRAEQQHRGRNSYYNPLESVVITILLEQIYYDISKKGVNTFFLHQNKTRAQFNKKNPMEIGVISFYAAQHRDTFNMVKKLPFIEYRDNDKTDEHGYYFKDLPVKLKVSIVDRFQGQEKDIIIIPLTRSNDMKRIGFLKSKQRINVAFSRPRHNLFIIGDSDFFKGLSRNEINDGFNKLVDYCSQHKLTREIPFSKTLDTKIRGLKRLLPPEKSPPVSINKNEKDNSTQGNQKATSQSSTQKSKENVKNGSNTRGKDQ